MGTNCAPLINDLFLYSYESEFLDSVVSISSSYWNVYENKLCSIDQ